LGFVHSLRFDSVYCAVNRFDNAGGANQHGTDQEQYECFNFMDGALSDGEEKPAGHKRDDGDDKQQTGAALANAIYRATGKRMTDLPMSPGAILRKLNNGD
jgi:hypothetical protein